MEFELVAKNRNNLVYVFRLAYVLQRLQRFKEAERYYKKCLSIPGYLKETVELVCIRIRHKKSTALCHFVVALSILILTRHASVRAVSRAALQSRVPTLCGVGVGWSVTYLKCLRCLVDLPMCACSTRFAAKYHHLEHHEVWTCCLKNTGFALLDFAEYRRTLEQRHLSRYTGTIRRRFMP